MRQHLQVLTPSSKIITPLPSLFTANDVRGVIHYLKKKPEGVTLGEAMFAIKKQVFEPRKFDAYQLLGIIVSEKDRFKLSQLGWDLARKMEPEVLGFREILNNQIPYRDVLAWADERKLEIIVHQDVATYWREHHRDALGVNTEKMVEASANSFFQLCQAAGLGTHIVGKKGQPTRLRVESDELHAFLHSSTLQWPRQITLNASTEEAFENDEPDTLPASSSGTCQQAAPQLSVFVSFHSEAQMISKQIQTALELADFPFHVLKRSEADIMHTPEAAKIFRSSKAGIIIISADDFARHTSGEMVLNQNVQFEIVTAAVLLNNRLLLMLDKHLPLDEKFAHLNRIVYDGQELTWENGIRLMKELKNFKCRDS